MRVHYSEKEKKWIECEKGKGEGVYFDRWLKQKLDNIKSIVKKNWDAVILIDGVERVGKSTLGLTIAYYLMDTKLSIENVSSGSGEDTLKKLENLPNKSLMIIDEGSLAFASTDTMKRETRQLHKVLNVIGQKNMILIIIAPSFFDLTKYISVHRSRFLIHCYTDKKMRRGHFAYFGSSKKKKLYEIGKKHFNSYNKPRADFVGRFVDFNPLGQEYIEYKKKSMIEALKSEGKGKRATSKRAIVMNFLEKNYLRKDRIKLGDIANMFDMSLPVLRAYSHEVRHKMGGVPKSEVIK